MCVCVCVSVCVCLCVCVSLSQRVVQSRLQAQTKQMSDAHAELASLKMACQRLEWEARDAAAERESEVEAARQQVQQQCASDAAALHSRVKELERATAAAQATAADKQRLIESLTADVTRMTSEIARYRNASPVLRHSGAADVDGAAAPAAPSRRRDSSDAVVVATSDTTGEPGTAVSSTASLPSLPVRPSAAPWSQSGSGDGVTGPGVAVHPMQAVSTAPPFLAAADVLPARRSGSLYDDATLDDNPWRASDDTPAMHIMSDNRCVIAVKCSRPAAVAPALGEHTAGITCIVPALSITRHCCWLHAQETHEAVIHQDSGGGDSEGRVSVCGGPE